MVRGVSCERRQRQIFEIEEGIYESGIVARHRLGGRHRTSLRRVLHSRHAALLDLHLVEHHQPVRAFGRRPLGGAGPIRCPCGAASWRVTSGFGNGGSDRRRGRQYDSAVLVHDSVADVERILEAVGVVGADIAQIAAHTNRDFSRLCIVAKAAELLDFATTGQGQVVLNADDGSLLINATPADRKAIWREHILQLRLFRETHVATLRPPASDDHPPAIGVVDAANWRCRHPPARRRRARERGRGNTWLP